MATISEIKQKIKNANALGVANLNKKGVEISADATTYEIMQNIADVQSGDGTEEFIGIKCSNFDSYRGSPKKVDARSLPDEKWTFGGYHYLFANTSPNPNGGFYALMEEVFMPKLISFGTYIFSNCSKLKTIHGDFTNVETVFMRAFENCRSLTQAPYMPNLVNLQNRGFAGCTNLTSFRFYKKPTTLHEEAFYNCTSLTHIYCPWSEGEVANAPWGATNAAIHYNWTEGEETNAES